MLDVNYRDKIAEKFDLNNSKKVICGRCAHWGYNKGGVMDSVCGSRCSLRKEKTYYNEWCRKFELKG